MDYDLVIIGSGPAGYVAAIRAGQLGLKTLLVEKERIGGMCLNWGCIPFKALLESSRRYREMGRAAEFGIDGVDPEKISFNWKTAVERARGIVTRLTKGVEYLLKKNGVEILRGTAILAASGTVKVGNHRMTAPHIVIATGSVPGMAEFPIPPKLVIEIRDLLNIETVPDSLAVLGGGANAVEMAQLLAFAGRKVALLAPDDRLLPEVDPFLGSFVRNRLKKDGVEVILNARISGYEGGALKVGDAAVAADALVNCSLRQAVLPGSEIDIPLKDGFIEVDDRLRSPTAGILAIGDVNGRSALAHMASAQGLFAANSIKGVEGKMDFSLSPINIYTFPEVAQIGLDEPGAKRKGIDCRISEFPLSANGKALTEGYSEGMIRMLSEKKYGEVLGVQIVAPHATDMIAEASILMEMEGTVLDVARTIHAHPTVSEIYMEAGFEAVDRAIHK
jgi:dihydrolipoamide dehydrogenase